jgi:hypothetical protein
MWFVAVEVRVEAGEVSVRCVGLMRWLGVGFATVWGLVATGSVVGGLVQGHWVGAAAVGAIGLAGVHWVLAFATSSVGTDHGGLRVRSGLLRRHVAAGDVHDVRVGGPTGESRVVLVVTRATGRPQRIKAVQQIYTDKNRQALEGAAVELSRALGRGV